MSKVVVVYIDRKIDVPVLVEIFLDSNHIQGRPTGKVIGHHILKLLADHGFNVRDCRGQAYDSAAVMSSQTKGASSVIKNEQPLADWVHCRNHCINLGIAFACKNTSVTNLMDSLTSVCYYLANSPKQSVPQTLFDSYFQKGKIFPFGKESVFPFRKNHPLLEDTKFKLPPLN